MLHINNNVYLCRRNLKDSIMKTEKQLIKNFTSLIKQEEKKENKDFTKILRFKRIIEIRKENN
jgi:hypothetical protein